MVRIPRAVADFLKAKRIAVAGVSRDSKQPANAIFRRLRDTGHAVVPINPNAMELEGQKSYPDLKSVPGPIDALMVVAHPDVSGKLVREASELGIYKVWLHRSFGDGSVTQAALDECNARGIEPIVGGCPMMYCGPPDVAHRFFRWWLRLQHRVPG